MSSSKQQSPRARLAALEDAVTGGPCPLCHGCNSVVLRQAVGGPIEKERGAGEGPEWRCPECGMLPYIPPIIRHYLPDDWPRDPGEVS